MVKISDRKNRNQTKNRTAYNILTINTLKKKKKHREVLSKTTGSFFKNNKEFFQDLQKDFFQPSKAPFPDALSSNDS